jgi:hypothetical protein
LVEAKARTVCRTPRVNRLKLLAFGIDLTFAAFDLRFAVRAFVGKSGSETILSNLSL